MLGGLGALSLPLTGFLRPSPAMKPALTTKPIPSTGELLPVIGMGTWQTFDVGPSDATRSSAKEVLKSFVELGGKLIDSSPIYGNSEGVVGDLAAELAVQKSLFEAGAIFAKVRGKALPRWASGFDCESWGQFFLKFIVSHPAVTCAIPATSKVIHLKDNMAACYGRLPDENTRKEMVKYVASL
jgi:aryl-alcohol dehydrogenase-like predicted oxidoreductase